jgi:hypothetical protein
MSASGYSFGLITNGEWQTVARNIEATNSNWSGGSVGQGSIPMGHSDFSPNHALPATDSSTGYTDTLNNAANGWKQRRTHWLSNGEIVWDLSGNVWEWVYEDKETLGIDHSNFERQEMPTLKSRNRLLFGPVNSFGKAQNMGLLWPGPNEAVGRGSSWGFDTSSGIFGASVGNNFPNSENISTGFRCVARPQSETTPRVVTNPRAATTPRTATTPRAATTPQEVDSLNFKCESFLDNQKFQYVLTDKNRLIVKDKSGKTVADVVAVDKKGASMTLAGEAIKVYFDAQSSSGNRLFIYRKSDSYRLILSHESVASAIPMRCRPDAINE